jgi:hypothetical protein
MSRKAPVRVSRDADANQALHDVYYVICQKLRHSAKIAFSCLQAGKCDFMRNPIWFLVERKPNRIPDKFSFVRCANEEKIFRNDAAFKVSGATK